MAGSLQFGQFAALEKVLGSNTLIHIVLESHWVSVLPMITGIETGKLHQQHLQECVECKIQTHMLTECIINFKTGTFHSVLVQPYL